MKVKTWTGGTVNIPWNAFRWWAAWVYHWTRFHYWTWLANRVRLRSQKKRRLWIAVSPAGTVDLGYCNEREAVAMASKMGAVNFVDWQKAVVIYGAQQGGPPPSGP